MLKNILIIGGIVIVAFIIVSQAVKVCFTASLNAPKPGNPEILSANPNAKKALVIYQPGITAISAKVAHQIARGLNDKGYEVTLDYPSAQLSADVSPYAVVVFGSPVYGEQPSKALTDYISRIKGGGSSRIVLYETGGFKYYMGMDVMEKCLSGGKAFKKVKFLTSAKKENDTLAYNLGKEL